MTEFDYLVIGGGGTAGCIVAARLAEDPAVSVGLVEWGPSDEAEPRPLDPPVGRDLEGEYDLGYRSVPQPPLQSQQHWRLSPRRTATM